MFVLLFIVLSGVLLLLVIMNCLHQAIPTTISEFKKFQFRYLLPYLLMTLADWLQGPYVFALYRSYGLSVGRIGLLFIFGFGSSMVFGTCVGGLADRFGRRLACVLYTIVYAGCCLTKHSSRFPVLLAGRIMGGISTSLLFSCPDSWMIRQHRIEGFDERWIPFTFALQTALNGVVAILAGLIGHLATGLTLWQNAMVAPFDVAILCLFGAMVLILCWWKENYGKKVGDDDSSHGGGFGTAWCVLFRERAILWLGIAQSSFEAAMYIFVFMWTSTLDHSFKTYSHGMIFAVFMVSIMIGSMLFNLLKSSEKIQIERFLLVVVVVAFVSFLLPIAFLDFGWVLVMGFNLFEACVGVFWPAVSTLKSTYIPEKVRATIMNYFRVPTNFAVFGILFFIEYLPYRVVFSLCAFLLCFSILAMWRLVSVYLSVQGVSTNSAAQPIGVSIEEELRLEEEREKADPNA